MVLDWGVHLLDQAMLIYPGVKLNTVYATVTHVTNQLVDDGFSADLGFANGVHIFVEVGTSNFIQLPRWYVLGADGSALIEDWSMNGRIVRANGTDEKDVVPVITAAGRPDQNHGAQKRGQHLHGRIAQSIRRYPGILSERDGRAGGETGKPDQAGRGHAGNASHGSHFRVG